MSERDGYQHAPPLLGSTPGSPTPTRRVLLRGDLRLGGAVVPRLAVWETATTSALVQELILPRSARRRFRAPPAWTCAAADDADGGGEGGRRRFSARDRAVPQPRRRPHGDRGASGPRRAPPPQPGAHRGAQRVNEPSAYAMSARPRPTRRPRRPSTPTCSGGPRRPSAWPRCPSSPASWSPSFPAGPYVVAVTPARWAVDCLADAPRNARRAGWTGRGLPPRRPRRGDILGQHPAAGPAQLAGTVGCWTAQPLPSGSAEEDERAPGELLDLAHLDPRPAALAGGVGVLDHQLQALRPSPGAASVTLPIAIEQAEPGGVSCTKRISSLTVWSWSGEAGLST